MHSNESRARLGAPPMPTTDLLTAARLDDLEEAVRMILRSLSTMTGRIAEIDGGEQSLC
jgi:hypothetical protein